MTLSAFSKLGKIKLLANKIQRTQLDIMYKKITQLGSVGMMDLELFFTALEELANTLFPLEISRLDALIEIIVDNLDDISPKMNASAHKGVNSKPKNTMQEKKKI